MGSTVFGTTDIAVIFVDSCDVWTSAFGTGDESFRSLAIGNGVAEAEATTALEEGGAVLEGADRGLAAKEVGRRAFHELEAIPVGVIEREDDASMYFAGKVFFAAEPPRFGKDASSRTNSVFHQF
jgi:hypothetical protein